MLYTNNRLVVENGNIELDGRKIMVAEGINEIEPGMHKDLTIKRIGRGLRIERREDSRLYAIFTDDDIRFYTNDKILLRASFKEPYIQYGRHIEWYVDKVMLVVEVTKGGYYACEDMYLTRKGEIETIDIDAFEYMLLEDQIDAPFAVERGYEYVEEHDDDYEQYQITKNPAVYYCMEWETLITT